MRKKKKVYLKNLNDFHLPTLFQSKKCMLSLISLQINYLQQTTLIFAALGQRQSFNFLATFKHPDFHCSYTWMRKIYKREWTFQHLCFKSETWTGSNGESRSKKKIQLKVLSYVTGLLKAITACVFLRKAPSGTQNLQENIFTTRPTMFPPVFSMAVLCYRPG